MKTILIAVILTFPAWGSVMGGNIAISTNMPDNPRVAWGISQLESALAGIGYKCSDRGEASVQITVDAEAGQVENEGEANTDPKELAQKIGKLTNGVMDSHVVDSCSRGE